MLMAIYPIKLPNGILTSISVDLENLKPPEMEGLEALIQVSISFSEYIIYFIFLVDALTLYLFPPEEKEKK